MSRGHTISDDQLREAFVGDAMVDYFCRKLPDVAPPDVRVRALEAVKFLFIAPECRGQIPVTKEIDDVWHYWILETQEYARLCSLLPTGECIHHCSNDYLAFYGEATAPTDDLEDAVRMLALYVQHSGGFPPDRVRYWRYASHLIDRCGLSVDELNVWLLPLPGDLPVPGGDITGEAGTGHQPVASAMFT